MLLIQLKKRRSDFRQQQNRSCTSLDFRPEILALLGEEATLLQAFPFSIN